MKNILKQIWPDALAVGIFLLMALAYFVTPVSQGLVLEGHDNTGGVGAGHETQVYEQQTGEHSRWTNSLFSGMPTYQISPSYPSSRTLGYVQRAYQLGTDGVVSYLFLYLIGFYILLRVLRVKPVLAGAGAVMWALSSYFLIIITAGHIWKVMTLGFIPPTIAGLILCYRGKLLWGGAVTALFTALQILSNHIQMSYYFGFVMLFIVLAYGVASLVRKRKAAEPDAEETGLEVPAFTGWLKGTAVVILAGVIGVCANVSNLYHTYEYQQYSMRGKAELTPLPDANGQPSKKATEGLERDYITQWSYGIGETMTLLVPNFKGGGSGSIQNYEGAEELPGYDNFIQGAMAVQQIAQETNQQVVPPGLNTYWGDQPGTVGPVYVGALVCFFFILGLFLVRGPLKWALLAATVVSLLFAWGKNLMPATDFFIDYLPLYNKFRTVSSALVIAEFTIPLLAVLCVAQIIRRPDVLKDKFGRISLGVSFALTGGICLLLTVAPGLAGPCISANDSIVLSQLGPNAADYREAISSMHHAILSSDALRSLIVILIGCAALAAFYFKKINGAILAGIIGVVCLVDLWQIDKRYLNDGNFTDPVSQTEGIVTPTAADSRILKDKGEYRVVNITTDIFNDNTASYHHHNIGGYHPAKLHRYQDMIERHIQKELPQFVGAINETQGDMTQVNGDSLAPVLNMLNLKYVIFGKEADRVIQNPYANGNGWFVQSLKFVKDADAEMAGLNGLDTKHAAVADETFRSQLETAALDTGTVRQTSYAPNELHYTVQSQRGGVVVFSEVYYPGWTATIDGKEAEVGRANYLLRALRVPAGSHEVVMQFRPASIKRTETLAYTGIALTLITFLAAVGFEVRRRRKAADKPKA